MKRGSKSIKNLKSLGIISCYFGKLPWYFEYFTLSCKYNQSIHFFIVTDDVSYAKELPSNVRLIYMSLTELNAIASKKLGFFIDIKYGYKLCDFKPAYGLLFSNLLEKYDFWGYGDIDVIFGNIRNFITNDILTQYELVSGRPDWVPGCFLILKNDEKMNTLFTYSRDYFKVFTNDYCYGFDETNYAHDAFTDGKTYDEINTEIESMTHVVKKIEKRGEVKAYFNLHIIEGIPGKIKWDKGKLIYRGKFEALLYHLIYFKKVYTPRQDSKIPSESFTISQKKIYHQGKIV